MSLVNKTNYKYGLLFTQFLLLAALIIIANTILTSGDWVHKAVDLSGGTEMTLRFSGAYDNTLEESILKEFNVRPSISRSADGGSISLASNNNLNTTNVVAFLRQNGLQIDGEPSVRTIGPALGSSFWSQAQLAIILGFVLMAVSIYSIYRSPVPSFAIVFSSASNIIETVAIMNLAGMQLSMGGVAALLMMIGSSVDNNVVMTTKLLKKGISSEEFDTTFHSSMITGLTMGATSFAALVAIVLFSPQSVITQIASVLIIGSVLDIPNTWLQNSAILRWHLHA
ncbi:MAG: hypothetical protein V1836_00500 [Candidatus Aenigmatarchaeota archaeon]